MRTTQLVGPTFLTTDLKFQLSKEGEGVTASYVRLSRQINIWNVLQFKAGLKRHTYIFSSTVNETSPYH